MSKLIKINLADNSVVSSGMSPVLLCFDKYLYEVSSWDEIMKIFFYRVDKIPEAHEYLEYIAEKYTSTSNTFYVSAFPARLKNSVKYSKELYVRVSNKGNVDNIWFMVKILQKISNDCAIWFAEKNSVKEEISSQLKQIEDELTLKGKKNRKYVKNTKLYIAHINGKILSESEKLFLRIEKEFDQKTLLGDIVMTDEEEDLLKQYMKNEIIRLNSNKSMFVPAKEKVFAYGMVRYAMKYYAVKTFWPYFEKEYGISVSPLGQSVIHDKFRSIMKKYGKAYDDSTLQIDNINMHCFVTDKCATQFYNYLYDFWKKELRKNVDNLRVDRGLFDDLIEAIKQEENQTVNIMRHTSIALTLYEKSCKPRIRRFLSLIDECYWENKEVARTGNRFNDLINTWMSNKNSRFVSDFGKKTDKAKRGETFLSKPVLVVDYTSGEFKIKLPREILRHCSADELPVWNVLVNNETHLTCEPSLMQGSVFYYTEECELIITDADLFSNIELSLASDEKEYAHFRIDKENIRIFDENGKGINYNAGSVSAGELHCFSNSRNMPSVLYKDVTECEEKKGLYYVVLTVDNKDILVFPDGKAIQVGGKLKEGISGSTYMNGVSVVWNSKTYPIMSEIPKFVFKAKKDSLSGTGLFIHKNDEKEIRNKVADKGYYEVKLDDSLDDIYAYLIDLNDYISEQGFYSISIKIPGYHKDYNAEFCYIKSLSYSFSNAPYIFKDNAVIVVPKSIPIITDGRWFTTETDNCLKFEIVPEDNSKFCDMVSDGKLSLKYNLLGNIVDLIIEVPALWWKYNSTDNWTINKPEKMNMKNIPDYLYVKGPFDFQNEKNKIYLHMGTTFDSETEVFAERDALNKCYRFEFGRFKSWCDKNQVSRLVRITLDGYSNNFTNIFCKSKMKNCELNCTSDRLTGHLNMLGSAEYSMQIKLGDTIIAQDIPVYDNNFDVEADFVSGTYTFVLYEIEEDDSGFDSYTYEIERFNRRIDISLPNKNVTSQTVMSYDDRLLSLEGRSLEIVEIVDHSNDNKMKYSFNGNKYYTKKLTLLGGISELNKYDIVGYWKNVFSREENKSTLEKAVVYESPLVYFGNSGNSISVIGKLLIVVYVKSDHLKYILLRYYNGQYSELLYDKEKSKFVNNSEHVDTLNKENIIIHVTGKKKAKVILH